MLAQNVVCPFFVLQYQTIAALITRIGILRIVNNAHYDKMQK